MFKGGPVKKNTLYHSETEQKLLINMNEGALAPGMFLPSHWESQTRHQVASRTYRTMHTGGDSCLAWTLRRWATKPNMKKKILKP